jgi:hypothetical protein
VWRVRWWRCQAAAYGSSPLLLMVAGAGLLSSLRGGFGRSVVPHPPGSAPGAGMLLPLALRVGLSAFRGRGFSCPERPSTWRGRGLSRLARRGGPAVPGCKTTPAWTSQARTSLISVVVN